MRHEPECKYAHYVDILHKELSPKTVLENLKAQGVIHDFQMIGNKIRVRPTLGLDYIEKIGSGPWTVKHAPMQHFIQVMAN